MLVTLNDVLPAARREGRAVGAFNVGNYETLLIVARAAEAAGRPVIVQLYNRLLDNGHGEPLAAAARVLAGRASVPMVLHLDHGASVAQVERALAAGFTSAMLDLSREPFEENVARVREALKLARAAGASLEAEIGHVPMGDGDRALTTPEEARRFYEAAGVDALAVAIGTAHGFYRETPEVDVELARGIARVVPVPLVLHGGSGTPAASVRAAVASGVAKVNVATEFQFAYQSRLRERLIETGDKFVAADLLQAPVVDQCVPYVESWIRFLDGSAAGPGGGMST